MSSFNRPVSLAVAIGSALSLSATQAAVITVDTLADPGSSEDCSLRSAVETLRTQTLIDGCYGDLDGIDDTIVFDAGLSGTITLEYGQLNIDAGMSINGPGPDVITVDANGSSRIATVSSSAPVAISGLTLTGGGGVSFGGALYALSDLALSDCVLTGNQASSIGGAMEVYGAQVTVDECLISDNLAGTHGGGIGVTSGHALVRESVVTGNEADSVGGGLWVNGISASPGPRGGGYGANAELQVESSLISGNGAPIGGGIGAGYANYGPEGQMVDRLRERLQNRHEAPEAPRGGPVQEPNLLITNSIISANGALIGGGIGTYGTAGGQIPRGLYGSRNSLVSDGNTITDNFAVLGGGVASKYGSAYLLGTTVDNNTAYYAGGGIASLGAYGPGPVFQAGEFDRGIGGLSGELVVVASTISGNSVIGAPEPTGYGGPEQSPGGGIFNAFGIAYLAYSQVTGNSSPRLGGGLASLSGASLSYGSTISANSGGGVVVAYGGQFVGFASRIEDNAAGPVGGLACEDVAACSLKYSSLTGNSGEIAGGIGAVLGLFNGSPESTWTTLAGQTRGGGYYYESSVEVINSTISGNEGQVFGGVGGPNLNLAHSTIAFNSQSQMPLNAPGVRGFGSGAGGVTTTGVSTITHSIIAENDSEDTANDLVVIGDDIAMSYSLVRDDQGFTPIGDGNVLAQDPLLGPLALNGSVFSLTHALLDASPAIDAGDPDITNAPDYDQRGPGFDRIIAGIIDIGAYESGGAPLPEPGLGLSDSNIDFGSVRVGDQGLATLTLSSTGTGPVTLGSIDFGTPRGVLTIFTIESDDCSGVSLPVGDSCDVSLGFAPDARDSFLADLVIPSDAPDSPAVVELSGQGVAPVLSITPDNINFGLVEVGTLGFGQVTLSNVGDDDLSLSGVAVAAPFSATSGQAGFCFENTPTELAPGASCSLQFSFAPATDGAFAELATIQSDSLGGDDAVNLNGTGFEGDEPPPPPVDGDAIPVPVMGHLATLLLGGGLMLLGWLGLRRRRI